MEIILGSTSRYRQALLQRLQVPFRCETPAVTETRLAGEAPQAMAMRLALAKAASVSARHPDALVIGSDQVATVNGAILGKPGGFAAAREQLLRCAGHSITFYTAIALLRQTSGTRLEHLEPFVVHFRQLGAAEIEAYLHKEQPYDCAGSFKCEGLGIALFERLEGADPTALEGLPLIALCRLLTEAGCAVLPAGR